MVPPGERGAMRGLLVGRFQPFHEGHRYLVDEISENVEEVVIGIGSADKSHDLDDPFTAGERLQMIRNALAGVDTTIYTVPIPDIRRNAIWVSHVASLCPRFDVVYTNNPFVQRLFQEDDYEVRSIPLHQRERFRGTEIRRRMIAGEEWGGLVPDPVAAVIDEIDGVRRLQMVAEDDDPSRK